MTAVIEISFPVSSVKCAKPHLDHGRYDSDDRDSYKLNEVVTAVCNSGYYVWGKATIKCCGLEKGESAWLPASSMCSDPPKKDDFTTECLTPVMYNEKCKEKGSDAVILEDTMHCEAPSEGRQHSGLLAISWVAVRPGFP